MKYKVKKFNGYDGESIQEKIETWVESREHIQIISTTVWVSDLHYAIIIYIENNYEG